jgi:hypothetical protein
MASSTGSVTGKLAAAFAAELFGVGDALAAGAGEAEVVGADGADVFVGAVVVQPAAASYATAATSASGDFHVVFNTSMPICF